MVVALIVFASVQVCDVQVGGTTVKRVNTTSSTPAFVDLSGCRHSGKYIKAPNSTLAFCKIELFKCCCQGWCGNEQIRMQSSFKENGGFIYSEVKKQQFNA